jgi:hypothetical protein
MAAGIETRHARACASRDGSGCDCTPTYQAHVFDVRNGRRIRKTFKNRSEAKTWRQDTVVAVRRGEIPATTTLLTVGAAVEAWIDAAKAGTVRTRGRNPFAPGTIRSVEQNYRLRIGPQFGSRRLDRGPCGPHAGRAAPGSPAALRPAGRPCLRGHRRPADGPVEVPAAR